MKEAMGLLVKATVDETMFGMQNGASFVLGTTSEEYWINVFKVEENGAGVLNHVAAQV